MHYRVKTVVNGKNHIYPEKFPTKAAAEGFIKQRVPATLIDGLMKDGLLSIVQESDILNRDGTPIQVEMKHV